MPDNAKGKRNNKSSQPVADLRLDAGLPANIDAEKTILGAILLDVGAFAQSKDKLDFSDFSLDSHRRIFLRMGELVEANKSIDIVTLVDELSRHKEVETIGGVAYLASLTEGLPMRPVIGDYIRIVKDKSLLRNLMATCSATISRAADQGESALEVLGNLESQIYAISTAANEMSAERAGAFLKRTYIDAKGMRDRPMREKGLSYGFAELDELTGGMRPAHLILLGGRPSMGKSALAGVIIENVGLTQESTVLVLPLEAGKDPFLRRSVCCRARIPYTDFTKGKWNQRGADQFDEVYEEYVNAKIFVNDKSHTVPKIRTEATKLKDSKDGLDLIVVDQLSFMESPDRSKMTRVQEVNEISRGMKQIALDLKVPVMLICHLTRESTKRTDPRPVLADLRESGALEQDADEVVFVHRPEYYDRSDESLRGKGELILAKQRDGPTDVCHVEYNGPLLRWSDPIDPNDLQETFSYWDAIK